MFSLIITIISIALVAALALATLYYGGAAFNKGSAGAEAARLINEGQQVNGAVAIFKSDLGLDPTNTTLTAITTVANLAPTYLAQVPASFVGTTAIAGPVTKTTTSEVCEEVNKRAGITTGTGTGAAYAGPAAAASNVFSCTTATGVNTFSYSM
jgi:hypothetical protein